MKKLLLISAIAVAATSCISVDYMGKQYSSTQNIEMYFDEADIKREFEVMGMLSAEASDIIKSESIQKKIITKAREKGADAVLFENMDKKVVGTNTNTNEDRYGIYSSTTTSEAKIVRAKLIKFM